MEHRRCGHTEVIGQLLQKTALTEWRSTGWKSGLGAERDSSPGPFFL